MQQQRLPAKSREVKRTQRTVQRPGGLCGSTTADGINAVLSLISAAVFVPASVGFLPEFAEYYTVSCWIYMAGSAWFLWASSYDAWKMWADTSRKMLKISTWCMVLGSALFVLGTYLILPSMSARNHTRGAYMFVAGSGFFMLGPFLKLVDVKRYIASNAYDAKLFVAMETLCFGGGILFTTGSVLFLPSEHREHLLPASAWTFIFGSTAFAGGFALNLVSVARYLNTETKVE